MNKLLFLGALLVPFAALAAAAEEQRCTGFGAEELVEKKIASAGTVANFRNAEGSLRYEIDRLLALGKEKLRKEAPAAQTCPAGCAPAAAPEILLEAVPRKLLNEYSEKEQCQALLAKTEQQPFIYDNRRFAGLAEFRDWFMDFSSGKGIDGENLYERCPGMCSPRYAAALQNRAAAQVTATATVICGHARDKGNNEYDLTLAVRRPCSPGAAEK